VSLVLIKAFETLGVKHTTNENLEQWCAEGALLLVADTVAAFPDYEVDDDAKLYDALFLLVNCDHFTRIAQADKEASASTALSVFCNSVNDDELFEPALSFHNELARTAPRVLEIIGDTTAKWVIEPNADRLFALRDVYLTLPETNREA